MSVCVACGAAVEGGRERCTPCAYWGRVLGHKTDLSGRGLRRIATPDDVSRARQGYYAHGDRSARTAVLPKRRTALPALPPVVRKPTRFDESDD